MPLTTARECAAHWGVSEAHARRILAPLDAVDRDPATGAMRYDQDDAYDARARRPGRGHRADLTAAALTPGQFRHLITNEAIPAPHRALWALLWEGLRIGDALSLDVRDVASNARKVTMEYPKNNTEREIPLSAATRALVLAALEGRTEGPLFVNDGRPLSREAAARVAHLLAGTSIHAFRAGGYRARKNRNSPLQAE